MHAEKFKDLSDTHRDSTYLTIVIPLYNEEDAVIPLIQAVGETILQFAFNSEIILIDDGSTDRTWNRIEALAEQSENVRALKLRRNFGQTNAMVAGFDHARGDVIVTMDGDLQNDPADIPELIAKMNEGFDIVSGWRKDRKDRYSRVFPSIVANYIISETTGVRLHDYGCSLKAYRAKTIKTVNAYGEMHRFFPALASMSGARIAEIVVRHHPRRHGISKYGPRRIYKVLSDIFAMNLIIRFSSRPLKGFTISALPFGLLTFFFGLLSVLAAVQQWTAGKSLFFFTACVLCAITAIHLVNLGVLGEILLNSSPMDQRASADNTIEEIDLNRI
jgi:glycosyltransferase involved in cell wall biosynthesis